MPYLGSESCKSLDLENHLNIGITSCESANTTLVGHFLAKTFFSTQSKPSIAWNEPDFMLRLFMQCVNLGVMKYTSTCSTMMRLLFKLNYIIDEEIFKICNITDIQELTHSLL